MTSQDFLLKINKSCLIKSVSFENLLSSIQEQNYQWRKGYQKIGLGKVRFGKFYPKFQIFSLNSSILQAKIQKSSWIHIQAFNLVNVESRSPKIVGFGSEDTRNHHQNEAPRDYVLAFAFLGQLEISYSIVVFSFSSWLLEFDL